MGLEKSWNGDLQLASLQPPASFPELYYPIWIYSGGAAGVSNGGTTYYLQKGSTSVNSNANPLFTISANAKPNQKYAIEATVWGSTTSSPSPSLGLWDVTANTWVTTTLISSSSTSATVLRSAQITLTPGHSYALAPFSGTTSNTVYVTDASLIVFPSSPLVSPSLSAVSLANPSGNTLKEAYYPLWVYSSGTVANSYSSAGVNFIAKGTASIVSGTSGSNTTLCTLSTSWKSNQKFAFEASLYGSNGNNTYASLYDITTGTTVGAAISTTATTATLIRSSSFTLNAGHKYGITTWIASSGTAYLTKAHLVALV